MPNSHADTKSKTRKFAMFITFEGGEGSGKSTQSKMLYEYLKGKKVEVILTREVGGTPEAEKIRNVLLHSDLLPIAEVMLVMAARLEHINKVILPALNKGIWVICDRFIDSTAAYQGQNSEVGVEKVYEMHKSIIGKIMPDITFFIDLQPMIALKRARTRGDNNKFEDKDFQFHESVYKEFQNISKKFKDRVITIKSLEYSAEEIHNKIISLMKI